jgi:hypothetical protein
MLQEQLEIRQGGLHGGEHWGGVGLFCVLPTKQWRILNNKIKQ